MSLVVHLCTDGSWLVLIKGRIFLRGKQVAADGPYGEQSEQPFITPGSAFYQSACRGITSSRCLSYSVGLS